MTDQDYLIHYGVLGMKWGVRKDKRQASSRNSKKPKREIYKVKTSKGEEMTLEKWKTPVLTKALSKVNKNVKDFTERTHSFDLKNSEGKKVGNIQTYRVDDDELNLTWGDVKKNHRGKGYMTAMMSFAETYAKSLGATKITGEVVNNSPDMQHIADKYGYVKVGQINDPDAIDTWGGLTKIEKKLKK